MIPNGRAFGILIEFGELAIGVALIGAAIALLFRWQRLSYREELTVWAAIARAARGATLMNVNFHLANGSPHPWLIPKDGFDEGVDMDSLLPLIQIVFLVVSTKLLIMLRRAQAAARAGPETSAPTRPVRPRAAAAGRGAICEPTFTESPCRRHGPFTALADTRSRPSKRRESVMKRLVVNIAPSERAGRVLIGAVGLIGGIALLASATSAGIAVLEVLLALAGLDLMVTGALGHCPLYRKLGDTPPSLRRPA